MADNNIFNAYTKRSPIIKNIQQKLEPIGRTEETIAECQMAQFDEYVWGLTKEISPFVDRAIISLMTAALDDFEYDFQNFDASDNKSVQVLKNRIVACIEEHATGYLHLDKISKINSAAFLQKSLPLVLGKEGISVEERQMLEKLLQELDGKAGMLKSFLITRITALTTWAPERVIDNYNIYKKNAGVFKKLLSSPIADDILREYPNLQDMTDLGAYNNVLTQEYINTYNLMISGISSENKIEKKGIKTIVSEYNQKINKDSKKGLPAPKKLHKQVLVPSEKQFTIKTVSDDKEALITMTEAFEQASENADILIEALKCMSAEEITVPYSMLHTVSHRTLGDHRLIPQAIQATELNELAKQLEVAKKKKEREAIRKKMEDPDEAFKDEQYLFSAIQELMGDNDIFEKYLAVIDEEILLAKQLSQVALDTFHSSGTIKEDKNCVAAAQDVFSAWSETKKLFSGVRRNNKEEGSDYFYSLMDIHYPAIASACRAKNKLVSFVTRKPGDQAQTLNTVLGSPSRGNSQYIQSDGKLDVNQIAILHRDGQYQLMMLVYGAKPVCIKGKGPGKVFTQKKAQDAGKFLTSQTFTKAKEYFEAEPDAKEFVITTKVSEPITITRELFDIYNKGLFRKSANIPEKVYRDSLNKYIDFLTRFISVYEEYAQFDIKLKPADEYAHAGAFFADINAQNYASEYIDIDDDLVDSLVEDGKALLFRLASRNLYTPKEKKPSYARMLLRALSEDPMGITLRTGIKFKFRKKIISNPYIHKKGSELINKRSEIDGSKIPSDVYLEADSFFNSGKSPALSQQTKEYLERGIIKHRTATKDIIKDKRYTEDQYTVTIPICKNSNVIDTSAKRDYEINTMAKDMNVLAAVRSGQDLVYVTVTSPKGELLESKSLNIIEGTDYWKELKDIADTRASEQAEEWKYGRMIKDNRNAYITRAISEIVRLVLKYQAVVVLEMISQDVKDRYSAFDNNMFKTFETALISRLSDLHFNDVPAGEPGSVENPYQLCGNTGNDFHDGIAYFIPKSWTANVDLETGFVNIFVTENITKLPEKKQFLSKFKSITYDEAKNRFAFDFSYNDFTTKAEPKKHKWTVYAGGPMVRFGKEYKTSEYIPETASELCQILGSYGLDSDFSKLAKEDKLNSEAVNALFDAFKRAVSGILPGHDGIRKQYISPVTGKYYDLAENSARALTRKCIWYLTDKKTRGEWVDHISGAI